MIPDRGNKQVLENARQTDDGTMIKGDGIATRYGLHGPGIETRLRGEIFRTRPDRPWGPPSLLYNGYRVFPGGKAAGEETLATHPYDLAPRLKKE